MKKWVIFSLCILLVLLLFSLSVSAYSAKLEITSYCDVTLESCRAQDTALILLQEDYPSDIEVHYLYYFDTTNAKSSLAQIALECANAQSKKDAYKTYLQDHLGEKEVSRATLKTSADAVGLAAANFTFCLDTQETAYDVLSEIETAEAEGATSVPSVRFNRDIYTGSQTYTSLHTLVNQYLGLTESEYPEETTEESTSQTPSSESSSEEIPVESSSESEESSSQPDSIESVSAGEIADTEQPLFFRVIAQFRAWLLTVFS